MSRNQFSENVWARGAADFRSATQTFGFWIPGTAVTVLIGAFDGATAALFFLGFCIIVWIYAMILAPFRQRNEARTRVKDIMFIEEEVAKLKSRVEGLEDERTVLQSRVDELEDERTGLLEQLEKECPIWIHEESGAMIVGKGDKNIELRGGSFPYRLIPDGSNIRIVGSSSKGTR
ncbi:MAG TPA: hypothetical protein EYQ36_05070 [Sulfitobacter sp.]|nr:hypothetical protein [Sulfitobacter sp.]